MPNFFYAIAQYADGHVETFEGCLWFLGGIKNETAHAQLDKLKQDHANGKITSLSIDYESYRQQKKKKTKRSI